MFLRPCYRIKNGKRHAYWALMESYRTARGPRQRVVAYLGQLDEQGRLGVKDAAEGRGRSRQKRLFDDMQPEWVEVNASQVRVENVCEFGRAWLGLELIRQLGLHEFLQNTIPRGDEHVSWSAMALVLVLCRLCDPSSELHIVEHFYAQSGLPELLGVPAERVNQHRIYRALDALLPHKESLETFLKERLGELFGLEYDLLLYDVTSTYFEGDARGNAMAQRGYSRDHRPDCKQVCIGLVVSKCGMPLGYEVFDGNRSDVTTLQEIVQTMERRYGRADRIWVTDRGMASDENVRFLQEEGRRYLIGTPKSMLKRFHLELLAGQWREIRDGVEVKLCPSPEGTETYILCRSRDRREKEKAMHERFERRIEEGLRRIEAACHRQRLDRAVVGQRLGRLLGQNSRAAGLFHTEVRTAEDGRATLHWNKVDTWRDWATLSEGCYLLRTNIADWAEDDLWKTYIQLTEAEAAFRIHKSDLSIRPIWHQK